MLSRLTISNYALIRQLEVEFPSGLNTVTGSTGAGKSIMLGALSLLMGARADIKKIARPDLKTIVEGEFDISGLDLSALLNETGVESASDNLLILRREILPSGRSRAFVNDSPVALKDMAALASRVVDIHSQHRNALICQPSYRLSLLDILAGNDVEKKEYKERFRAYVNLRNDIKNRRTRLEESRKEEEFIRYRLEKLQHLRLSRGEQQSLERKLALLSNSAQLSSALGKADALLQSDGEDSVLIRLHEVQRAIEGVDLSLVVRRREGEESLSDRLETAYIELQDISLTIAKALSEIESDPALLEKIDTRLNDIYEAQQYFKVQTEDELIAMRDDLASRLQSLESGADDIADLEHQLKPHADALMQAAEALTQSRLKAAEILSSEVTELARPLGMPNINFQVELSAGKLTPEGRDICRFMCAFNKNQSLIPIDEGASGGELSRLMLCLKSIMAARMAMPTLIFDEIDTGVSGDIAAAMADMMLRMAQSAQLIVITHLPQVAAKGTAQFQVYKEDTEDETQTSVRRLTPDERVEAIARMLSGSSVNEAAMLNARTLLESN